MKTCDTCEYEHKYNNRIYFPCNECEVTKQEKKEFFDTLDEKLKIAKGQFEICDRCKQNTIEALEILKSEITDYSKTLEFINHTTFVSEEKKTKRFIELEDVNKQIAKAMLELKGENK